MPGALGVGGLKSSAARVWSGSCQITSFAVMDKISSSALGLPQYHPQRHGKRACSVQSRFGYDEPGSVQRPKAKLLCPWDMQTSDGPLVGVPDLNGLEDGRDRRTVKLIDRRTEGQAEEEVGIDRGKKRRAAGCWN